jgi:hypothetical protein
MFLYCTVSKQALGSTQPSIKLVPVGALSSVIKQPGREAGNSHPSSAEFKNGGNITPISHTSSWRSA